MAFFRDSSFLFMHICAMVMVNCKTGATLEENVELSHERHIRNTEIRFGIPTSIQHADELKRALVDVVAFEKLAVTQDPVFDGDIVTIKFEAIETIYIAGQFLQVGQCSIIDVVFKDSATISLKDDIVLLGECTGILRGHSYTVTFSKPIGKDEVEYEIAFTGSDVWKPHDLFDVVAPHKLAEDELLYPSHDGKNMFDSLVFKNAFGTGTVSPGIGFEFVMSGEFIDGQDLSPQINKIFSIVQFYSGDYSDLRCAILIDCASSNKASIVNTFFGSERARFARNILPLKDDKLLVSVSSRDFYFVNNEALSDETGYHVTPNTRNKIPRGANVLFGVNVKERYPDVNGNERDGFPENSSCRMYQENVEFIVQCEENITGTIEDIVHFAADQLDSEIALKTSECRFFQFVIPRYEEKVYIRLNLTSEIEPVQGIVNIDQMQLKFDKPTINQRIKNNGEWKLSCEGKYEILEDLVPLECTQDQEGNYFIEGNLRIPELNELIIRAGVSDTNFESLYSSPIYDAMKNMYFIGLRFKVSFEASNSIMLTGKAAMFGFLDERISIHLVESSGNMRLFMCYIASKVSISNFINSVTNTENMNTVSWIVADKIAACMVNSDVPIMINGAGYLNPEEIHQVDFIEDVSKQALPIYMISTAVPTCSIMNHPDKKDHLCMSLKKLVESDQCRLELGLDVTQLDITSLYGAIDAKCMRISNGVKFCFDKPSYSKSTRFRVTGNINFENQQYQAYIENGGSGFARLNIPSNIDKAEISIFGLPFVKGALYGSVTLADDGTVPNYLDISGTVTVGNIEAKSIEIANARILYNGLSPVTSLMYGNVRVEDLRAIVKSMFRRKSEHWLEKKMKFIGDLMFAYNGRDEAVTVEGIFEKLQPGCNYVGKASVYSKEWRVIVNLQEKQIDVTAYLPVIENSSGNFRMTCDIEKVKEGPTMKIRYYIGADPTVTLFDAALEGFIKTLGYHGYGKLNEVQNLKYQLSKRVKLFDSVLADMEITTTDSEPVDHLDFEVKYIAVQEDYEAQLNDAILRRVDDVLNTAYGLRSQLESATIRAKKAAIYIERQEKDLATRTEVVRQQIKEAEWALEGVIRRINIDCTDKCNSIYYPNLYADKKCVETSRTVSECTKWGSVFYVANTICIAECESNKICTSLSNKTMISDLETLYGNLEEILEEERRFNTKIENFKSITNDEKTVSDSITACNNGLSDLICANKTRAGAELVQVDPIMKRLSEIETPCYDVNEVITATVMKSELSTTISLCSPAIIAETANALFDLRDNPLPRINCFADLQQQALSLNILTDEMEDVFNIDIMTGETAEKPTTLRRQVARQKITEAQTAGLEGFFLVQGLKSPAFVLSNLPKTRSYNTWLAMNKYSPWVLYNETQFKDLVSVCKEEKDHVTFNRPIDPASSCPIIEHTIESLVDVSSIVVKVVENYNSGKALLQAQQITIIAELDLLSSQIDACVSKVSASIDTIEDMKYWANKVVQGMTILNTKIATALTSHSTQAISNLRNEITDNLAVDSLGTIPSYIDNLVNNALSSSEIFPGDLVTTLNSISKDLKTILNEVDKNVEDVGSHSSLVAASLSSLKASLATCTQPQPP